MESQVNSSVPERWSPSLTQTTQQIDKHLNGQNKQVDEPHSLGTNSNILHKAHKNEINRPCGKGTQTNIKSITT